MTIGKIISQVKNRDDNRKIMGIQFTFIVQCVKVMRLKGKQQFQGNKQVL